METKGIADRGSARSEFRASFPRRRCDRDGACRPALRERRGTGATALRPCPPPLPSENGHLDAQEGRSTQHRDAQLRRVRGVRGGRRNGARQADPHALRAGKKGGRAGVGLSQRADGGGVERLPPRDVARDGSGGGARERGVSGGSSARPSGGAVCAPMRGHSISAVPTRPATESSTAFSWPTSSPDGARPRSRDAIATLAGLS